MFDHKISLEFVNNLMRLYLTAIEYYTANSDVGPEVYMIYVKKQKEFLQRQDVQVILSSVNEKKNIGAKKEKEDVYLAIPVIKPNEQKKVEDEYYEAKPIEEEEKSKVEDEEKKVDEI